MPCNNRTSTECLAMTHSNSQAKVRDKRSAILTGAAVGLAAWYSLKQSIPPSVTFAEVLSWSRWIPLRCPLKFLTGLDCPLCGLGRSFLALAWGDASRAWTYNPMGPVLAGLAILSAAFYLLSPVFFQETLQSLKAFWRSLKPHWKYLALALYFLVFVVRNA